MFYDEPSLLEQVNAGDPDAYRWLRTELHTDNSRRIRRRRSPRATCGTAAPSSSVPARGLFPPRGDFERHESTQAPSLPSLLPAIPPGGLGGTSVLEHFVHRCDVSGYRSAVEYIQPADLLRALPEIFRPALENFLSALSACRSSSAFDLRFPSVRRIQVLSPEDTFQILMELLDSMEQFSSGAAVSSTSSSCDVDDLRAVLREAKEKILTCGILKIFECEEARVRDGASRLFGLLFSRFGWDVYYRILLAPKKSSSSQKGQTQKQQQECLLKKHESAAFESLVYLVRSRPVCRSLRHRTGVRPNKHEHEDESKQEEEVPVLLLQHNTGMGMGIGMGFRPASELIRTASFDTTPSLPSLSSTTPKFDRSARGRGRGHMESTLARPSVTYLSVRRLVDCFESYCFACERSRGDEGDDTDTDTDTNTEEWTSFFDRLLSRLISDSRVENAGILSHSDVVRLLEFACRHDAMELMSTLTQQRQRQRRQGDTETDTDTDTDIDSSLPSTEALMLKPYGVILDCCEYGSLRTFRVVCEADPSGVMLPWEEAYSIAVRESEKRHDNDDDSSLRRRGSDDEKLVLDCYRKFLDVLRKRAVESAPPPTKRRRVQLARPNTSSTTTDGAVGLVLGPAGAFCTTTAQTQIDPEIWNRILRYVPICERLSVWLAVSRQHRTWMLGMVGEKQQQPQQLQRHEKQRFRLSSHAFVLSVVADCRLLFHRELLEVIDEVETEGDLRSSPCSKVLDDQQEVDIFLRQQDPLSCGISPLRCVSNNRCLFCFQKREEGEGAEEWQFFHPKCHRTLLLLSQRLGCGFMREYRRLFPFNFVRLVHEASMVLVTASNAHDVLQSLFPPSIPSAVVAAVPKRVSSVSLRVPEGWDEARENGLVEVQKEEWRCLVSDVVASLLKYFEQQQQPHHHQVLQ